MIFVYLYHSNFLEIQMPLRKVWPLFDEGVPIEQGFLQ